MRATILVITLAFGGAAHAQSETRLNSASDGYTYFNRPGANLQQHHDAIESCVPSAIGMDPPQRIAATPPNPNVPNTYGLVGSLMAGALFANRRDSVRAPLLRTNYENCMIVQGWRVVQLEESVGREIARLDRLALAARMEPMISAEAPDGVIVRAFSNQIAHPDSPFLDFEHAQRARSLSLMALPATSFAAIRTEGRRPTPEDRARERQVVERFSNRGISISVSVSGAPRVTDFASAPADSGFIVTAVRGENVSLTFTLVENLLYPHGISVVPSAGSEGVHIYAVPPGVWRLDSIVVDGVIISFCMGSPSFSVGAGEIVYAGVFDFTGRNVGPDMTMAPAEASVAAVAPEARERLRPAVFQNGSTRRCRDASYLYAFEIADAPFAEDYRWGSRAFQPQPQVQ